MRTICGCGRPTGLTDELLPKRDELGLLVYGVNYGLTTNINQARLPLFARVDVRRRGGLAALPADGSCTPK